MGKNINFFNNPEINYDKNIAELIKSFFMNLILNIENPKSKLQIKSIEARENWYKDVLEWCDTEEFWFACWKEFFGYDENKLRKKIKEKVYKGLNLLEREKNEKPKRNKI